MKSFDQLYEQYLPMMHSILNSYNIQKDRDDYIQIASIALWKNLNKYDSTKAHFHKYVYMTMKFAIVKEIRKQSSWQFFEEKEENIEQNKLLDDYSPEITLLVQQLLQQLTEVERIVVTHYYMQDMTYSKIGQLIGKSEEAVRKIKMRALMKLKTIVKNTTM